MAAGLLLRELVGVIEVLTLALLIALIMDPAVNRLQRLRIPRWLATLMVVGIGVALITVLGSIMLPLLAQQVGDFLVQAPNVARSVQNYILALQERYPAIQAGDRAASVDVTSALQEVIQRAGELWNLTTRGAGLLFKAMGAIVMALYMVSNPKPLVNGVLALFPVERRDRVQELLTMIHNRVSGWIIGQLAAIFIVAALTWLGLSVLGIKYALTFAVLTGILEIIPFFGPILSAILPTLVALTDSPTKALLVVIIYLAIHQIEAHLISPLVIARSVRLHPVVVIVAVLVMGDLLGLIGVVLAVPTAAVATVLLDELYVKPLGGPPAPRAAEVPEEEGSDNPASV